MGAADFIAIEVAPDAAQAFAAATLVARHEHGHGGYTGTIAEKGEYVGFGKLPPRWSVANLASALATADWVGQQDQYGQARIGDAPTAKDRATVARFERDFPDARHMLHVWCDKWGPAVCVEVTGAAATKAKAAAGAAGTRQKVWAFLGLASL